MNKTLTLLALYFLCSCGRSQDSSTPQLNSEALKLELARITPLLYWYKDMPASGRPNNIDGTPNADTGDGMSELGFSLLYGNHGNFEGIKNSVTDEGRAYRCPAYVNKDTENSFSRDQFIGLIEATLAKNDDSVFRKFMSYFWKIGKLCPDATDSRCDLTPNGSQRLQIIANDILKTGTSDFARVTDMSVMQAEAATSTGYAANLIAREIMLKVVQKKLTKEFAHAATLLAKRFPKSIWFSVVDKVTHAKQDFVAEGEALLRCMNKFEKPENEWLMNEPQAECVNSNGHDLVVLAKYLLGENNTITKNLTYVKSLNLR